MITGLRGCILAWFLFRIVTGVSVVYITPFAGSFSAIRLVVEFFLPFGRVSRVLKELLHFNVGEI